MTEAEWLTTTTRPQAMLTRARSRLSVSKLRLIAVGCCRLRWDLFTNPTPCAVIEAIEDFAERDIEWERRTRLRARVSRWQRRSAARGGEFGGDPGVVLCLLNHDIPSGVYGSLEW